VGSCGPGQEYSCKFRLYQRCGTATEAVPALAVHSLMQFAACHRGTIGQNVNLSGEAGYVAQCLQPSCECVCVCVYLHTVLTAKRHSN